MYKWTLGGCCLLCLGAAFGHAQAPGVNPATRPAFSPYLNLNRQGNSATLNYFGLVRPQLTVNSSIQQLQQQVTATQQQESTASNAEQLPPTGHASGFLNHSKYFLTRGGATSSVGTSQFTPQPRTRNLGVGSR